MQLHRLRCIASGCISCVASPQAPTSDQQVSTTVGTVCCWMCSSPLRQPGPREHRAMSESVAPLLFTAKIKVRARKHLARARPDFPGSVECKHTPRATAMPDFPGSCSGRRAAGAGATRRAGRARGESEQRQPAQEAVAGQNGRAQTAQTEHTNSNKQYI